MTKPERITDEQIRQLLAYAQHIGDGRLAACAMRALDGDSMYNDSLRERCAAAYAGARVSADFRKANNMPHRRGAAR